MHAKEDFTIAYAERLFGSRPSRTGPEQNFVWNWPLGAGAEIHPRLRVAGGVDVVEVPELPGRPRLLPSRGQEPVQLLGGQLVSSRVRVAEQRVSAVAGLGEDFGERGLPVASVQAVEGGLLPARLHFGAARLGRKVGLDAVTLRQRKGVNVVPGTVLRRNVPMKLHFHWSYKMTEMEKDPPPPP